MSATPVDPSVRRSIEDEIDRLVSALDPDDHDADLDDDPDFDFSNDDDFLVEIFG